MAITLPPASAIAIAAPLPKPFVAPVIKAVLPFKFISLRKNSHYCAVQPPSTNKDVPVIISDEFCS